MTPEAMHAARIATGQHVLVCQWTTCRCDFCQHKHSPRSAAAPAWMHHCSMHGTHWQPLVSSPCTRHFPRYAQPSPVISHTRHIQAPGCIAAPATAWPRAGMQPNTAVLSPCLTEQMGLLGAVQAAVHIHAAAIPVECDALTLTPVLCSQAPNNSGSFTLLAVGPPRTQDRTAIMKGLRCG